jgi:hypothetical protein
MNRRILDPRFVLLIASFLCASVTLCETSLAAERPNVVLILADDMGYGDLGCYGCPDNRTPNIDVLARGGVRLTNFYSNGPECSPTRTGLMTGRYQHRVGGLECAIGVGNVMLIGVLERRSEIGLRRALGATKGHIRIQFLTEALLLALLGGAVGAGTGALATAIYAHTKHWTTVIPALAWASGIAAALLIGAIAGLLPALRAARMSPTQALWTL